MSDAQVFMVKDYETVSEADLKKVGAYNYCAHPSTKILCVSSRTGTRAQLPSAPIRSWSPAFKGAQRGPHDFVNALYHPGVHLVAHNSFFEYCVTHLVLPRHLPGWSPPIERIPFSRYTDTAALAATHALPRKLEDVCPALGLPHRKDMAGHRLMMKMSKPRKPTKHDPSVWHRNVEDLKRLIEYCEHDIAAETDLFLALPPLSPFERKIWELDQEINWRGVAVDQDLVRKAIYFRNMISQDLAKKVTEITDGIHATQGARLLEWLNARGADLPNLQAKTVSDWIAAYSSQHPAGDAVRQVLEFRADVMKSSTKKYDAFASRTSEDGRLRGSLIYHGASTGRWVGAGVQPQNFPRGAKGISGVKVAEIILDTPTENEMGETVDLLCLLYGSPMEALAAALRPCFVASGGKKIVAGDFNAIELRVLFWFAGHDAGLQAIRENRQMYREMGEIIFVVKLPKDEGPEREVGKRAILGCGFGMGWKKFGETCAQFGSPVPEAVMKKAVAAYRSFHAPVPALWANLEKAAIAAVQAPGQVFRINRTEWWVKGKFLYCKLPSGRTLPYMHPSVRYEETPWGEMRPKLYHFGTNPRTKKWENQTTWGGTLTENVVQATARDLMAAAMPRLEAAGYPVVLTVHDEIITETPLGHGSVTEFEKIMAAIPAWAEGCPVKVKAFEDSRYRK